MGKKKLTILDKLTKSQKIEELNNLNSWLQSRMKVLEDRLLFLEERLLSLVTEAEQSDKVVNILEEQNRALRGYLEDARNRERELHIDNVRLRSQTETKTIPQSVNRVIPID